MSLQAYLDQFEPMRAGKIKLALERTINLDGVCMSRVAAAAVLLPRFDRVDWNKGRFHTKEGTFYDIASLTKTLVEYIEFMSYEGAIK